MGSLPSFVSLCLLSLLFLGASPSVQGAGKVYARTTRPLTTVSLDLETREITRGPAAAASAEAR